MTSSPYDNWREYATDLALDIKQCHERINALEEQLKDAVEDRNAYRLKYSQERLHVAALRQEQRDERRLVVPYGDADEGYECPVCFAPAGYFGEFNYCPGCGAKLDWSTYDDYAESAIEAADREIDWREEEKLCS